MIFPFCAILALLAVTPTTNTLLIAILIPILGVVSPLLIARQINKNARETKELDWEREDIVAEKAAEAARLVVERQLALDAKTDEVARLVATSTTTTNDQLEKIHGLVNSQLTQAVRSELAATRDTLALMSELIANHRASGIEPSVEVLASFKGRESKIAELEETLRVREEADAASKLVNTGPREVVIVGGKDLLGVSVQEVAIKAEDLSEKPTPLGAPTEVVIVNENPVPVTDIQDPKEGV